jgi:hypothetical protein
VRLQQGLINEHGKNRAMRGDGGNNEVKKSGLKSAA